MKDKIIGTKLENIFECAFENWRHTTGFDPVELLATANQAGSYETSELHVFKLKRGYAIVHESGCSCYESSDAKIDILPSLKSVKESLKNSAKEQYSHGNLAKEVLLKLIGAL